MISFDMKLRTGVISTDFTDKDTDINEIGTTQKMKG